MDSPTVRLPMRLVERAHRERVRPPDEAHEVLEDEEEAEGDEELVLLRATVQRPQQGGLEHGAQSRRRHRSRGEEPGSRAQWTDGR